MSGAGSAEELGILQWLSQGCIERSQGIEGLKLPLSAPGGAQLAPTSQKVAEG